MDAANYIVEDRRGDGHGGLRLVYAGPFSTYEEALNYSMSFGSGFNLVIPLISPTEHTFQEYGDLTGKEN